jgi:hypothetical protein
MDLDPETSTYVGNRLMEFLELNIGRSATLRLLDGASSFAEECQRMGILPDIFVARLPEEIDGLLSEGQRLPEGQLIRWVTSEGEGASSE